jgi:hypothetical protein
MEAKIKQRLDFFEVLRSGDLNRVKLFIGDTLDGTKSSKSAPLSAASEQRASVMQDLLARQPLLHCCVGEQSFHSADSNEDNKGTVEDRLAIARYLIGLRNHSVNLGITDNDGRTALHLAAKKEDSAMLKLLLSARDESAEKKSQLDINSRCTKSGWTPLHYAAGQGDVPAVRLLMEAGASLLVHAVIGKGATPLEVVKTRLQNSGHFSSAHISNLQQVAKELSEAVRNLEKIKQQKETERLLKEEKQIVERQKLAEREEKERELLERKQKQLKDKQERDRLRTLEEETNRKKPIVSLSPRPIDLIANSSSKIVASSQSSLSLSQQQSSLVNIDSSLTSAIGDIAAASNVDDSSKAAKKKKKKDRKKEEEIVPPPITVSLGSDKVTVVDVASRDELVDHLLAMGFAESDCLAAISLYGKDLDRSLSWLCDKPAKTLVPPVFSPKGTDTYNVTSLPFVSGNMNVSIGTSGPSLISAGNVSLSNSTAQNESIGLQKEKDHKEELRRINRAWNQKAEDEKRRVNIPMIFLYLHFECVEKYYDIVAQ